ncbi:MAG: BrnA antitoxin family protein [Pseudomonadota bacterium]
MHRADPFMLDDDIAADDDVSKKVPPVPAPVQTRAPDPAPSPPPALRTKPPEPPKGKAKAKRGRPKSDNPKRQVTLRLDGEIIEHFKGSGRGWQTRINNALREAAGLKK